MCICTLCNYYELLIYTLQSISIMSATCKASIRSEWSTLWCSRWSDCFNVDSLMTLRSTIGLTTATRSSPVNGSPWLATSEGVAVWVVTAVVLSVEPVTSDFVLSPNALVGVTVVLWSIHGNLCPLAKYKICILIWLAIYKILHLFTPIQLKLKFNFAWSNSKIGWQWWIFLLVCKLPNLPSVVLYIMCIVTYLL